MRNSLFALSALILAFGAYAQTPEKPKSDQPPYDCSKPPASCEKPVKWLTDKENCSCFACEYGKPGRQHTVCTSNNDSKFALMRLSHGDGEELAGSAPWDAWEFSGGKVWVNTKSGLYYKGEGLYGKSGPGKFMPEADAKAKGFKESPDDKDWTPIEIKGMIVKKGTVVSLTDKTGKTWHIVNPDVAKVFAGQDVDVTAHVNEKKDQLLVLNLQSPGHKEEQD
jgi:hypothetical protein